MRIPINRRWLAYLFLVWPIHRLFQLIFRIQKFIFKLTTKANTRFMKFVYYLGLIVKLDPRNRGICETYFGHLRLSVPEYPIRPTFSVLMPVYNPPHQFLKEALASVAIQTYESWELCIVDDASTDPEVYGILESFAQAHPGKVSLSRNSHNMHISGASNRCLEMATGEYVVLLDHDDRLYPNALSEVVRELNQGGEREILFTDSRPINESGEISDNFFYKPQWSPFLHLSFHYTAHLSIYSTRLLRKIGGFRKGYEGAQDYDLMLRASEQSSTQIGHVPFCLYQWRVHARSTAASVMVKPYAVEAGEKALTEACSRRGRPAIVKFEEATEHYRVRFELPRPCPIISIIVPTKNRYDLVEKCLSSVLRQSTYNFFEVLVLDNGSDDERCHELYKRLALEFSNEKIRVFDCKGPFNFGRLNNLGARLAKGSYLVLLNNDTEVLTPEWLEELLRYAQFAEVGAVGAKLHYEDERIQHAGLVLRNQDIAGSAYEGHPPHSGHYYWLADSPRETSAVTAACLMISRRKYLEVGGLDEVVFPNGYGDVDFCLKLRAKGLSNIYTPYAKLFHYESATRGIWIETFERHQMIKKWGRELIDDPYLNPNLERSPHFQRSENPVPELTGEDFQYFLNQSSWFASSGSM